MPPVIASRRHLLQAASALGFLAFGAPLPANAQPGDQVIGRVLALSDLHSAYERTAQLLAAFEAEVQASDIPHVIVLNGDIFEHGNVVSVRSEGVIDWALMAALPALAPTVVNLGNHDNDLINDLAEVVARMQGLGIHVVTTIVDPRTGEPYAPSSLTLPLGDRSLRIVGLATNALHTYPKAGRDLLSIPAPEDWARDHLAEHLKDADLSMVLCHVGVAQERMILPLMPKNGLMIGGHNHLLFQEEVAQVAYAHTGSWTNFYTVAEILSDGPAHLVSKTVALDGPQNPQLSALIAATLAKHLTEADQVILGRAEQSLSLGDTGRQVALGMARAAGADAGFIGHTTLGTGLTAGPISQFMFDAIVRFDGKLMVAEVTQAQFASIMNRANQDRDMPLAQRGGDFVYGAGQPAADQAVIRIATNDWNALNQAEYFGTTNLKFTEVASPGIKAISVKALLNT